MTSRPDPLAHLLLWSGAAIFVVAVLVGAAACHSSATGPQVGDPGIDLDVPRAVQTPPPR